VKRKLIIALVSVALVGVALFQVIPALADTPNPLDHVVISPTTTTLPVGGLQQFSAQAYDSGNQVPSGVSYFWLITAGGGNVNRSGATAMFTAGGTPGTYTNTVEVLAVQGAIVKIATASVTVTGNPGALDHVTVTPASVTVTPGATQQLTAQAYDSTNVPIPGLAYTWSALTAAGTITNINNNVITFTAGTNIGTFANAIQASTVAPAILKTGVATVTVATQAAPMATTPNFDASRLIKMFNGYLTRVGFDNFLGGQWQVKNATGGIDTIKLIPGVVQAVPSAGSQILTVLPNGGGPAVNFTLSSSPVIQPKSATLAVNEKVVVVTVNDSVTLVAVINPVTTGTLPPGLQKQDENNRQGKPTPPGWSHGKKTGWNSGNDNKGSDKGD
jgi:hypothetical protein